jgi:16S rRNA (uracil1498-N3)-methyltransferase
VPSAVSLIIGPEGGFAELEAAALVRGGALACSLGRTILRTETAGPAAIAMILYELELDGAKAGTQWQNA